jgi:hypothetical protein
MKKFYFTLSILCAISFFMTGCLKKIDEKPLLSSETSNLSAESSPKPTKNPFSLQNVKQAISVIANEEGKTTNKSIIAQPGSYPNYKYFKFNPNNFNPTQLQAIEKDSGLTLMNFPFADPSLYSDSYALDSAKAASLEDGNVYGIALISDPTANTLITSSKAVVIDTLVLLPDSVSSLSIQAMKQSGYDITGHTPGICLLKKPHGTIKYQDNDFSPSRLEPVRGMLVWALVFGIPVTTYTDANGNYTIPWRFSIGTILGTKAKNGRVNVKPLDTHSDNLAVEIGSLILNFIVGSVHVQGWANSCTLNNNYDFNFTTHSQERYWCQLLNAYYFHDQYCAQAGIYNAPQAITCYAQWAGNKAGYDVFGRPELGGASTPLLGHINLGAAAIGIILNNLFGANVNLSSDYPNLFNLLTGLLPDNTFQVPQAGEPTHYSSRLAQEAFHELGHASMYRQVGDAWWVQLVLDEITSYTGCNPYGGSQSDFPRISLAESWAQFIGTNFALKRYPSGYMESSGGNSLYAYRQETLMTTLLESEGYFYCGSSIPYGIFNDFIDPFSSGETWDNFSGETISMMFNTFQPNISKWCDWENKFFTNSYNQTNQTNALQVFSHYTVSPTNLFNCGIVITPPPPGPTINGNACFQFGGTVTSGGGQIVGTSGSTVRVNVSSSTSSSSFQIIGFYFTDGTNTIIGTGSKSFVMNGGGYVNWGGSFANSSGSVCVQ